MNNIIVPTGYMGSGSSAISDLLDELDCIKNTNGSFEYIFMHCPDGVFDLEDKLLLGNNAIRSDEVSSIMYIKVCEVFVFALIFNLEEPNKKF